MKFTGLINIRLSNQSYSHSECRNVPLTPSNSGWERSKKKRVRNNLRAMGRQVQSPDYGKLGKFLKFKLAKPELVPLSVSNLNLRITKFNTPPQVASSSVDQMLPHYDKLTGMIFEMTERAYAFTNIVSASGRDGRQRIKYHDVLRGISH
ncbi:hypothetical protein BU17DRAFT_60053 [Hysterangium stoloniferum]|nr:hypothetical protein BU17DRAFT_60053 [Hysterangium stoloniferum]